ncbi:MAG: hypothetical protein HC774_06520 [Sphingomonadales bacterium]|nr:hypothetical protein [Sphingomonadales bacterium]
MLPTLTINGSFIQTFFTADTPCCAIGLVEESERQFGFLALRPKTSIPTSISAQGFSFGHSIYGSSEFQYIAFDELTELHEEDYLFLFSRLRKAKLLDVPLRIRSASNPGNIGHLWVKERFIDAAHENRRYIPSLIADNQYLDAESYRESLTHLMPVTRERLMNGDWNVQERGIFRPEWIRHYMLSGEQFNLLHPGGSLFLVIPQSACRFFMTVDPAGTSDDSGSSEQRSFSVIQVWPSRGRGSCRSF